MLDPELVEHLARGVPEEVVDGRRLVVEGRDRGSTVAPASVTASMFRRWIRLSGVSRVTSTNRRRSLRQTSAARGSSSLVLPVAMDANVRMEHGMTTMPIVRNEPDEIDAARSSGSCTTSARAAISAGSRCSSNLMLTAAPRDMTRCVSTDGSSRSSSSSVTPR